MPPRRSKDPLDDAEAVFRPATPKVEAPPPRSAIPNAKESVTLRIDQDVLHAFQEDGPGWQDRINDALRKAAGL